MNTDSRRKASATYHAKRKAGGLKKVTLWLSPEARFKLDALKAVAGSKDRAANDAIVAWSGPDGKAMKPDKRFNNQLGESFNKQHTPRAEPPAAPESGQTRSFGPVTRKPGSLLKVKK